MEVYLSKEQFRELLNICRANKREVSGKMYFTEKDGNYSLENYEMDEKDKIAYSTESTIKFKLKELLQDLVCGTFRTNDKVYVNFHTHPGFLGAVGLSDADRSFLKYSQEVASKVTRVDGNKSTIIVVEAVISRDKIGFYYYDTKLRVFKRARTYVNKTEIIPDFEADGSKIRIQVIRNSSKKIRNSYER